jgi:hypothetical protein
VGENKTRSPEIKAAKKKRYNWPPPIAPEDAYVPREKNPIHSILTALPVIMLIVGLYVYYKGESEQNQGIPIYAESQEIGGVFTGLSVVKSGSQGRHYLWVENEGSTRGIRIRPDQVQLMEELERGIEIQLSIAPTVTGSGTYWAWRVSQDGKVALEMESSLQ